MRRIPCLASGKCSEFTLFANIPDLDSLIMTATNNSLPIGTERYVRDSLFMTSERLQHDTGVDIPDMHSPLCMPTDNPFPIGTERYAISLCSMMSSERLQ